MHPLLKKLQRRFSRSPNVLQTRSAAELLPFRSLRAHWILGRSLCMYSCLNFAQVPRSRREAALRYRMPALSPFERTGHCAVWSGSEAMVWYWDADVVDSQARQELLPPAGADPAHCPVLPETLFRPPQQDGLHVQACSEGYEVQHWRANILRAAFWTAAPPSPQRLAAFADSQGLDAGADAPKAPVHEQLLDEPWSAVLSPREWLAANELRLAGGIALLLCVGMVWQGARHWRYGLAESGLVSAFEAVQAEVAPLMAARRGHRDLSVINAHLAGLLRQPSQAYLMGLVDQAMPHGDARFEEWHFQEGELQVVVENAQGGPVEYVRLLEGQPAFVDVRVEQAGRQDRLRLSMRVAP